MDKSDEQVAEPSQMPSQAIDALKTLGALNYTPHQVWKAYIELGFTTEDDQEDVNPLDDVLPRLFRIEKSITILKRIEEGRKEYFNSIIKRLELLE